MSDRKTINVTGAHCIEFNYKYSNGTFVLEVYSDKYFIKIHLERWALKALAQILWKVLRREKQEITEAENMLRSGE